MHSTLEITKPHSDIQRIMMQSYMTPKLLESWYACGTKFGKTAGISNGLLGGAYVKRGTLWRWVAPILSQSKIGLKYHRKTAHPTTYDINKSDPSFTFLHNDTRIEYKSGKFPEDLEGEGVDGGYALDECAKMSRQVYDSAKTTVTVTRAHIAALSTPKGKNWFYNKCMEAKQEMEWAIARGIPPTKIFLTAPTSANPHVSPEAIEEARKSLPDRLFRQYYLAEFLEDGSTFSGFRDTFYTESIDLYQEHQTWFHAEAKECEVVIGADWAKTTDWTVFIAIDTQSRRVVAFERFHKRPYTEAIRQLVRFSRSFKDTLVIYHDKTGVGEAMDDQLAYTDLPYHGIVFTNKSKTNMVNGLITSIEAKRIFLPRWNVLDSELDAYEVTTNDLGTMTYAAAAGHHDDTVCSLMLANSALEQYGERSLEVSFLEDMKEDFNKPGNTLEAYYRDLADDED